MLLVLRLCAHFPIIIWRTQSQVRLNPRVERQYEQELTQVQKLGVLLSIVSNLGYCEWGVSYEL